MRVFAQRCRACGRKWLVFTTLPGSDPRCWWCDSTDLEIIGTADARPLRPPEGPAD